MPSTTLDLAKKLREQFPELSGDTQRIRIKPVKRQGRTVFQLLYEEGGKAKAPQLTAKDPLSAYEEARALLTAVIKGEEKPTNTGRLPPTGHIRRAERKARIEYEKRNTSDKTFDQSIRYLERLTGWFGETSKPLNADTLREYILTTDQQKRERRGAIQAAMMIADVEDILLKVPSRMKYLIPAEKEIHLADQEKRLIYDTLENMENIVPNWISWVYRLTACTGCRANNTFGMEIPARPFNRDRDNLVYYDTKRQLSKGKIIKIKPLTTLFRSHIDQHCGKIGAPTIRDEDMFNAWKLYEIPEEIEALRVIGRPPNKDELKKINDRTTFAMDTFRRACRRKGMDTLVNPPMCLNEDDEVPLVGFRILRKLCVERMFLTGHNEYDIEKQISTSKKEIERVYSSIYKNDYISRSRSLMQIKRGPATLNEIVRDASNEAREAAANSE